MQIKYYYAASKTLHTTHADGTESYQFANGQTETVARDGTKEIRFPDMSVRRILTNGVEELILPDGTRASARGPVAPMYVSPSAGQQVWPNGDRLVEFADGTVRPRSRPCPVVVSPCRAQSELHTAAFKQRNFPNGTKKIVYSDGRRETHFADGQVRVRGKME